MSKPGMTKQEMADFMERVIFPALIEVRGQAQAEYAHGEVDNAFNNFDRGAVDCGIDRKQVLWVYLAKHLDGIKGYLRGIEQQREPIQGRIKDAMMYLSLLWAMVEIEDREITEQERLERIALTVKGMEERHRLASSHPPDQGEINSASRDLGSGFSGDVSRDPG